MRWLGVVREDAPPVEITARVWALRADAPDTTFWWELLWRPRVADLDMMPHGTGHLSVDRARTLLVDGLDLLHGVRQGWESLEVVIARLEPMMREVLRLKRRLSAGEVAKKYGLNRQYFAYEFLPSYGVTWQQLSVWRPGMSLRRLAGLSDPGHDTTRQSAERH